MCDDQVDVDDVVWHGVVWDVVSAGGRHCGTRSKRPQVRTASLSRLSQQAQAHVADANAAVDSDFQAAPGSDSDTL